MSRSFLDIHMCMYMCIPHLLIGVAISCEQIYILISWIFRRRHRLLPVRTSEYDSDIADCKYLVSPIPFVSCSSSHVSSVLLLLHGLPLWSCRCHNQQRYRPCVFIFVLGPTAPLFHTLRTIPSKPIPHRASKTVRIERTQNWMDAQFTKPEPSRNNGIIVTRRT